MADITFSPGSAAATSRTRAGSMQSGGALPSSFGTRLPYSGAGGALVRGGSGMQDDRPYADVGKQNINLLYTGDQAGWNVADQQFDMVPGESKPFAGTPLSMVDDYFSQQGGFFAGIAGAIGSAIGGTFGGQEGAATGAQIGATIGKIPEIPLGFVGSVPLPTKFIPEDWRQGVTDAVKGTLFEGVVGVPTSLGEGFMTATGAIGLLGRAVERTVAGAADTGNGPLLGFVGRDMPDKYKAMVENGELTEDQALDQMVLDGQGFSDNMWINLAASLVLDPVNLLSLGVGGAIKATGATVKVAEALNVTGRLRTVDNLTGVLGELQSVARSYAAQGRGMDILPEDLASRSRLAAAIREVAPANISGGTQADAFLQLGRMERLGLHVFGPVTPGSTLANVATKTDTLINVGLNKLFGQESMPATAAAATKHTSTAVASGMIKALGVSNVERMASAAEELMPGGRGVIEDAMAVGAGNKRNEVMLDMQISDGMKNGRVPVVEGSTPGQYLTPYDAQQAVLKRSPFQRDIGKHTELLTERDKPFLYASGRSADQVQMDTYRKMAEITGRTVDDVQRVLGKVDEGMAQAVHAAYYYHKGYSLHRTVVSALKAMPVNALPKWLRGKGFIDRLTQVGARTLTNIRAKEIRALVDAKDFTALRDKVAGFREFDNLSNDITDADLLAYVDDWLTKHNGTLLTEVPLHLPDGSLDPNLPMELKNWAENSGDLGYRLALAPPDDLPGQVLYRESRNKDGVLNGMSPWMPFEAERLEDVSLPGRWERLHMQALSGIRQERINWTNRRRFVTEMATGSQRGGVDIPPGLAQRMFDAIMVRASETNVQPRGLSPSSIVQAARSVLRDEEYKQAMRGVAISDTQLLMGTLRAFRGDLSQVGLTQAVTGTAKVRLPGSGRNMWGQIAENLYPLMRFSVNPVFLTMELIEPYILGAMRGITVPLRKSGERYQQAVATHESVEKLLRSGLNPEGSMMEQAEKLSLMRDVTVFSQNRYGKTSRMGRFFDRIAPGDIQRRKSAAMAMQTEKTFGRMMKESMQSIMGDEFDPFWRGLQDHYQTVDDGTLAMRWAMENLAFTDANGTAITHVAQLLNPANLGQRARFTLTDEAGAMSFRDVADTLDASIRTRSATKNMPPTFGERAEAANAARMVGAAPLHGGDILYDEIRSGRMSREDVHDLFTDLAMNNSTVAGVRSNADQLWMYATGATAEELRTKWRAFTDPIRGKTAHETRVLRDKAVDANMALIRARAFTMGMTEDEYVRLHWQREGIVTERALAPGVTPVRRSGSITDPLLDQRRNTNQDLKRLVEMDSAGVVDSVGGGPLNYDDDTAFILLAQTAKTDNNQFVYQTYQKDMLQEWIDDGEIYIDNQSRTMAYDAASLADHNLNPLFSNGIPNSFEDAMYVRFPHPGDDIVDFTPADIDLDMPGTYYMQISPDAAKGEILTADGWKSLDDITKGADGLGKTPDLYPHDIALANDSVTLRKELDIAEGRAYPPTIEEWSQELMATKPQRKSSEDWEGWQYGAINAFLRGIPYVQKFGMGVPESRIVEMVKHLDQLVRRSVLPEDRTLYRGVNASRARFEFNMPDWKEVLDHDVGDTISDPGFQSWADNDREAAGFAGNYDKISGGIPAGEIHQGVVFVFDAPAGMRFHMIGGGETEHLIPRDKQFVIREKKVEKIPPKHPGDPESEITTYRIMEAPSRSGGTAPGVKRLMMEEAAPYDAVPVQLQAMAALDPDVISARATHYPGDNEIALRADQLTQKAKYAKPNNTAKVISGFGRVGQRVQVSEVIEDLANMPASEIHAIARGPQDFISRLDGFMDQFGPRALPVVAHFLVERGTAGFAEFLQFVDHISYRGATLAPPVGVIATTRLTKDEILLARRLLKGGDLKQWTGLLPSEGPRGVPRAESDIYDILMGNLTRRADGRSTGLSPVFVNRDTVRGAGYVTNRDLRLMREMGLPTDGIDFDRTTITEEMHEAVTVYYNHLTRQMNREKWMGRGDWSPAEISQIVGASEAKKWGDNVDVLTPNVVDDHTTYMPMDLGKGPLTKKGRAMMQPIFDILAEPQFRQERMNFIANQGHADDLMIQDSFGVAVDPYLDFSVGEVGAEVNPMMGLKVLASRDHARSAADLLAFTRYQEDVRVFERVPTGEIVDPAYRKLLTPRVQITIPARSFGNAATPGDTYGVIHGNAKRTANHVAAKLGKDLGIEGLSVFGDHNGDIVIQIIDGEGRLTRLPDGNLPPEQIERAIADAFEDAPIAPDWVEWDNDFGDIYHAGPDRTPAGKPDWDAYTAKILDGYKTRGLDGWSESRLHDLRTETTNGVRDELQRIAPKQYDRVFRGEPVVPDILEDARSGTVHGAVEFDADRRAVVRAFGSPDPVTGLHELMHVFATDLSESQRTLIMKVREDVLTAERADQTIKIAEYRAKAAAAKTNRTRSKWASKADALEADLGELVDESNFGVEHEEFFVSQALRWFKTGTLDGALTGNTELVAAFEHFRNWINNIWQAIVGKRDPSTQISPQMNHLFNQMFNGKPVIPTAAYGQTEQALRMAAYQNLGAAFDESFQTQQFKRDRSPLERSLNHPYIGMYPLSYMWGKVLPETIAFLALNPFGMKTPLLGWNAGREISDTIRARTESDPAFAQWMKDNKEAFQLFSMLFPALPQDIPANASLPLRRIAEQGLMAEEAARLGGKVNPIDWSKGGSDAITYALGPLGTFRMGTENIPSAIDTLLHGSKESQKRSAKANAGIPNTVIYGDLPTSTP